MFSANAFASDPLPNELPEALSSAPGLPTPRNETAKPPVDSSSDLLIRLATEVDDLNKKLIVQGATERATQTPRKVRMRGARTVFNYSEDGIYEVLATPDHVTDVALAPGEQITSPPTAGDTVRWTISVMKSGDSSSAITHLIIKPLEEEIETNLIITTDSRTYQLKLRSSDTHMPSVAWNYPVRPSLEDAVLKKEPDETLLISPETLSFSFELSGDDVSWRPIRVFSDGQKTYLQMPSKLKASEAPVLLGLSEDSEPVLLNYRVNGDYYIVDRVIERAELRVGTNRSVLIEHETAKSLSWIERLF
jgi:type IV secretion system protein VirB9